MHEAAVKRAPRAGVQASRLELVLKVAERCNINCTYCYYFNKGNDDFLNRPPYISESAAAALPGFLANAAADLGLKDIAVSFHGGEPLMVKKPVFDSLCASIREAVPASCQVVFAVQTNGMLIDQAWLELFSKHDVHVGVSIDGPQEINDRFRIDHSGRGTFDKAVMGFRAVQQAAKEGWLRKPGVLAVLDTSISAERLYRFLTRELEATLIDLLLPHATHETSSQPERFAIEQRLREFLALWVSDDDGPAVDVRIFDRFLQQLGRSPGYVAGQLAYTDGVAPMTVYSDGEMGHDDNLRFLGKEYSSTGLFIQSASAAEFLHSSMAASLREMGAALPAACRECHWQNVCAGGPLNERHSQEAPGFTSRSIYCGSYDSLLTDLSTMLLSNGMSREHLAAALAAPAAVI